MTVVDDARELYARAFGSRPEVIASAPGRVNLIGEHTDYCGGDVLPIAIDARTVVAMGKSSGGSVVTSTSQATTGTFVLADAQPSGQWWDYVAGALRATHSLGVGLANVNVAIASSVPLAAGLSSSAALEVATVFAASCRAVVPVDPASAALAAHRADHEFVGIASGIMDQFASALGRESHAMLIACDTQSVQHVPFDDQVLIFDTGVSRGLRTSDYQTRLAECNTALAALKSIDPAIPNLARAPKELLEHVTLPEVVMKRARHVIEETARVRRAVDSLMRDRSIPADLLYESHRSLATLYDCSTPELDWFVEAASRDNSIRGARLTGAGWGGCAIAIGDAEVLQIFGMKTAKRYRDTFSREARWWVTRASAGARIESVD